MNSVPSCVCFISFLTIFCAVEAANSGCLEREKTLALLETAGDFLTKAKDSYPSCGEDSHSTNQSECSGQRPLAYIEISKKLISDVRENFPTCNESQVIVPQIKHRGCYEIFKSGRQKNGVYTIWPSESNKKGKPLQAYCDMENHGGGWTVIQRRGKYPIQQDFYLDWESYKIGFGNLTQEFWWGNENILVLCKKGCEIRFDLQDEVGIKGYAVYKNFYLSGNNYTIDIRNYTGNIGDGMVLHDKRDFSTKDKGNINKANRYLGAMWYSDLNYCNFNGVYQPGKKGSTTVHWQTWREYSNLASVEIKVRPK